MIDVLALADGGAVVEIVPRTGGAIANFTVADTPVLRPTAPEVIEAGDVRRHACYPLVPYSNRIDRARLDFNGASHQLDLNFGDHPHSIHGVGWQRAWSVVTHDRTSALLAYEHRPTAHGSTTTGESDARAWPWPFRAVQWFALSDHGAGGVVLRTRLTIANTGSAPFPFGLGWHPFFPCDVDTELGFRAGGVWESDPTILPTRHVAVAGGLQFDPPRRIAGTVLDNLYTDWSGVAELRDPRSGRITILRGDSASRYFVCYIPPHGMFLAIEPVTHMTDAFNRAERGETGTGARVLAPGESFSISMEIASGELV